MISKPYSAVFRHTLSAGNRTLEPAMNGELMSSDGTKYSFVRTITVPDMVVMIENLVTLLRLVGRWDRAGKGELHILKCLAGLKEGNPLPRAYDRDEPGWEVTCPRRHAMYAVVALAGMSDSKAFDHPDFQNWVVWHVQAATNALGFFGPHPYPRVFEAIFGDLIMQKV